MSGLLVGLGFPPAGDGRFAQSRDVVLPGDASDGFAAVAGGFGDDARLYAGAEGFDDRFGECAGGVFLGSLAGPGGFLQARHGVLRRHVDIVPQGCGLPGMRYMPNQCGQVYCGYRAERKPP